MKLNPLAKPSVTDAVRSLETALADLEKAEAYHFNKSQDHYSEAAIAEDKGDEESANAERAKRIREKLADLLA